MGKDKDMYRAGKAAVKAIKYNISAGPAAAASGGKANGAALSPSYSSDGSHGGGSSGGYFGASGKGKGKARASLDSCPPAAPSASAAAAGFAPRPRRASDSRPPSAGAGRRFSADYYAAQQQQQQYYHPPAIAHAHTVGESGANGYGYGYGHANEFGQQRGFAVQYASGSLPPSRPASAAGSHQGYAHAHTDDDDDYIERDLGEMASAHAHAMQQQHSGQFYRPPSSASSPYAQGPTAAGGAGIGTAAAGALAAVTTAALYDAAPPPPPGTGMGVGTRMEVGSVYSAGTGSLHGHGAAPQYGPYGLYAEAPLYASAGGYANAGAAAESVYSGGTAYDASGEGALYGYGAATSPPPSAYASLPPHHAYSPHAAVPMAHAPSSDYPDLYSDVSTNVDPPNAIFGVSAPHHVPGAHARDSLGRAPAEHLPGFPTWSRTWYGGHLSADGHAYTTVPPNASASGWESETLGSGSAGGHGGYPYGGGPYGYAHGGRHGPAPGQRAEDYVKEERMRMLAKEFMPKVKRRGEKGGADSDEDGPTEEEIEEANLPPGSLTRKGHFVHAWPRLVKATRILQVLLPLIGALLGLGGAFLIKVPSAPAGSSSSAQAPAPRGTMPSFVLYGATVVVALLMLWLFVFRPCCCSPQKRLDKAGAAGRPGAGMVIPVVAGAQGGKRGKNPFGKKGKLGRRGGMGPGTTVNLIVDPAMLGGGAKGGGAGDSDSSDDASDSSDDADEAAAKARRRRRRAKKRSKQLALRLQARWAVARRALKQQLAWDCVCLALLVAAAVFAVGIGKKCPAGAGAGWCNWYNGAIACACIAAAVFLAAVWWDIADLRASSKGPRPGIAPPGEA